MNYKNELRKKVAAINMHPNRNLLPFKTTTNRYLICSTQRSGSTLLADLLDNTSLAGRPLEYFNNVYIEDYCRTTNTTQLARQKYWDDLQKMRTTNNGVFGAKAHLTQIHEWLNTEDSAVVGKFLAQFDHLIFIQRKDKLGQAISLYRALVTGHWSSQHTKLDPSPAQVPQFDAQAIASALQHILVVENKWKKLFSDLSLKPIQIDYEALTSNPALAIHSLLQKMGIDSSNAVLPGPKIKRQSDGTNDLLRNQFLTFINNTI